jgi:hypothetical protein
MSSVFTEPVRIAALMADYPHPWAICGGWSIDLFLGNVSRTHKDVDVAVLRRDQLAAQSYLAARGWSLEVAHEGRLRPWQEGARIELPLHVVWCRNSNHDPNFVEILLNEADGDTFRFRRDQSLTLPLDRAFISSGSGLPVIAPELALLYKSANIYVEENAADFVTALPHLGLDRRAWLKSALERTQVSHPWLQLL